jgi:glycosyltransferase involved in cell wall biosynthesis
MYSKQKMAFIKIGKFSHVNDILPKLLVNNFPGLNIDIIDIFSDLLNKKDVLTLSHCLNSYGWDILLGRKTIYESFLKTQYASEKISTAIRKRLIGKNYLFTFQTQSVFDASIPEIPHFVYSDHTHLENLNYPGFSRKRLFSKQWIDCERKIYQRASLNFTMSSNIRDSIINDYKCGPEKVLCVYCGSNVQVNKSELFDDTRYSKKNILFVGIDWERKGGPVLVKAFRKVLEDFPDAHLTIVGCSPKIDLPNCNVIGRVSLKDVKKYFEQASLFCLPTLLEPFGIVFLEAMAHKLPVIGSRIGAIPDFINEGENGYLIEPKNSQQLADKIMSLLISPEKCKSFGEKGHHIFWDRYTWEKTGERISENIKLLL